jgi:glutamate/tyrosine decarboxylase-like PLP-dependent enzyme
MIMNETAHHHKDVVFMSRLDDKIASLTEKWLTEILPVAEDSVVGFVDGITMANFYALEAARTAILQNLDWDVELHGLYGAPRITVVIGEGADIPLLKALSLLGIGRDRVIRIPSDANGRMQIHLLPQLDKRTIVCLQAGCANSGAMDSGDIILRAKDSGAWFHIDGAFGLWTAVSDHKKHLTQGYKLADSWATDGRQCLDVPYDNGLVICRHVSVLRKVMSIQNNYSDYFFPRAPCQLVGGLSSHERAMNIWSALHRLDKSGIEEMVTRTSVYAEYMATKLSGAGYNVLNRVDTNQVLVSFGSDEVTNHVIQKMKVFGTCWYDGAFWKGRLALRISVVDSKITEHEIKRALDIISSSVQNFRPDL